MEKVSILAATPQSARRLHHALSRSRTEILATEDHKYLVEITLALGRRARDHRTC
jgi:hypothetical protein